MGTIRSASGNITAVNDAITIDVPDAGSVLVAIADTPTPNVSIVCETWDGFRWHSVQVWDPISSTPTLGATATVTGALTRIGNVACFAQFRVRCTSFTAPAFVTITAESDVISVPPMLGAVQNVRPQDPATATSIASNFNLISAATTNDTLISAGTKYVYAYEFYNSGAAVAYVKLYNKATAPTSSDTPSWVVGIPAGQSRGLNFGGAFGLRLGTLGLGLRITGGSANNDTTAVAAGQVTVSIGYT